MEIPVGFRFHKDEILRQATAAGLDPMVVAAVCWQESGFNTDAFRHEPNFWNRYLKQNAKYRHLNPRRVSSSYGLMQVMYPLVHEDDLIDNDALPPEHLFVPEFGLRSGCSNLLKCLKWATANGPGLPQGRILEAALAAYNGGRSSDNKPTSPVLRNGRYSKDVLQKLGVLRAAQVF